MSEPISQREARALRKRVAELEQMERDRRKFWSRNYPGGTHIGSITWNDPSLVCEAAYTARKLGHAVVAVPADDRKTMMLYALPLPEDGHD